MKTGKTLALCLAAAILCACGGSSDKEADSPEGNVESSASQEVSKASVENKIAKVGDTIDTSVSRFTVNSAQGTTEDLNALYTGDSLEDGQIYFVIDATAENTGDEELDVNGLTALELKDADGREMEREIGAFSDDFSGYGIAPGDKITGRAAFVVPAEGELFLYYYPETLGKENVKIQVR